MSTYTIPNVIAQHPRGERIMDVYSHLLTERIIYLGTPIDSGVANALIAQVRHSGLKLHMDVKAQSSEPGGTVPELIARHAPRAGHFHAQDTNLRGPGMGAVDFGPILKALVASGYDRWVSVEVFDYSAGAEETAAQSIRCLRRELDAAVAARQ